MGKFIGTVTDRSFFACIQKLINTGISIADAQDKYMRTRRPDISELYDCNKIHTYQDKRFYKDEY